MSQDWARKFYNSKAWIRCRNSYRQSKHYICERCGKPGDEVHHKEYLTPDNINDPEITLSWDYLELLCSSCHSIEHNRSKEPVTRGDVMFDEDGDLVPVSREGI